MEKKRHRRERKVREKRRKERKVDTKNGSYLRTDTIIQHIMLH